MTNFHINMKPTTQPEATPPHDTSPEQKVNYALCIEHLSISEHHAKLQGLIYLDDLITMTSRELNQLVLDRVHVIIPTYVANLSLNYLSSFRKGKSFTFISSVYGNTTRSQTIYL